MVDEPATGESVDDTCRRLSRETISPERDVLVGLRDARHLDDEIPRPLLRRLDLEEAGVLAPSGTTYAPSAPVARSAAARVPGAVLRRYVARSTKRSRKP